MLGDEHDILTSRSGQKRSHAHARLLGLDVSKIAFLSFPEHGHINPTLGLVRELVRAGHDVLYYAGAPFREPVAATGAEFRDYGVALPAMELGQNLVHSTNIMFERADILYERMFDELAAMRPDLIIHDGVCGWAKCIAAYLKIPAVSSISSFAMNESILKSLNTPGETLKFFYYLLLTPHGKKLGALIAKQHERLQKCGLPVPPKGRIDLVDFSTAPEKLNIVYATRDWQPQGETFDDTYKFIGPSIERESERGSDGNGFDFDSGGKPLVYLSMGTILNRNVQLYRDCFGALRDLDVRVVVSAGDGARLLSGADVPRNVSVFPSVPQLQVLERADLFISQGGMNSVTEAMVFQVPMILIPVTGEQALNARRVAEAGAGIVLRKLTPGGLRAAVQTILGDPQYRQRSAEVSQSFRNAPGVAYAAQEILRYAGLEVRQARAS